MRADENTPAPAGSAPHPLAGLARLLALRLRRRRAKENAMRASKENARLALEHFEHICRGAGAGGGRTIVREFLAAAEARLPSEEAYLRDEERRRAKGTAAPRGLEGEAARP